MNCGGGFFSFKSNLKPGSKFFVTQHLDEAFILKII